MTRTRIFGSRTYCFAQKEYKKVWDTLECKEKVALFQRDSGNSVAVWIFAFAPSGYPYGIETPYGKIMNVSEELFSSSSVTLWQEQKRYVEMEEEEIV